MLPPPISELGELMGLVLADALAGQPPRRLWAGPRGHGHREADRVAGDRPRRPAEEERDHQQQRGAPGGLNRPPLTLMRFQSSDYLVSSLQ